MAEVGDIINNQYKLITTAGSGRTSVIFRAEDINSGEVVAIKSLRHEYLISNPDGVMRFMREGAVLKQVEHPHIIRVMETIEMVQGSYIVMEYLSGGTLEQKILTDSPLDIEATAQTMQQITDAMCYLHDKRIIHRDISPMNIMFHENGSPKLMDLSVAHMGHMSPLTIKSALLGTVTYMSPELILGESKATEKSDIWALGMTFYKAFAGQLPFELKQTRDVINLTQTPAPPIRELREDVPEDIESLLQHMLQIDREQRIGSMEHVNIKLKDVLARFAG